jgi:hypothetical protein
MASALSSGIKETMELMDAMEGLLRAVDESLGDDGRFTLADLAQFFPLWGQLAAAAEGISEIPSEFKDLSPDELHALAAQGVELGILVVRVARAMVA